MRIRIMGANPTYLDDSDLSKSSGDGPDALIPSPGGGDSVASGGFEAGLIQGGERGRFAMPVPLRTDFDANALRAIARTTKDGPQARRLLALAAIYDGATRTAAARIGGVTVQIVRDW